MSRRDYAAEVINVVGEGMGMPALALDAAGRVTLLFGELPITLAYSDEPVDLLWLWVELGEVDLEQPEALDALLQLGFLTWSWGRFTIGLGEDDGRVLGQTVIPVVNLEPGVLNDVLGRVLETATLISDRLARRDYALDLDSPNGTDPSAGVARG